MRGAKSTLLKLLGEGMGVLISLANVTMNVTVIFRKGDGVVGQNDYQERKRPP